MGFARLKKINLWRITPEGGEYLRRGLRGFEKVLVFKKLVEVEKKGILKLQWKFGF